MAATLEILESGETSSDGEAPIAAEPRRSWGKMAMAGATTGALLLCAGAGAAGARLATRSSAAAPQFNQLEQIVAMPGPDTCAATDEDCMRFGCCDVSGYHCFETTGGKARCMKNCTPGTTKRAS